MAAGDFAFGIADTEEFRMALKEGEPVGVVFPDQHAFGTPVIPAALVLIQHGLNPEQGKRFINLLLLPETRELLVARKPVPSSPTPPMARWLRSM